MGPSAELIVDPGLGRADQPVAGLGISTTPRVVKRAFDLLLATILLLALLPLAAVIVFAIMMDSPGPPLFVHRRVGKHGRPFGVLKFRTMAHAQECDPAAGPDTEAAIEWRRTRKLRSDPRVTRVGRLLRKYSLDEVPQLLNVVAGQMSLVGPRPVVVDEIELFGDDVAKVLSARPGMTGLWAVNGRNLVSYRDRVRLESSYIDRWSLLLDLKILCRTIPCVLSGRGAC